MIRRALSSLIIFALLIAWGGSAWQVRQLRAQVRALQTENRVAHAQVRRAVRGQKSTAEDSSWLSRADAHFVRAQDALSRADVGRSERELTAGAQDMRLAARGPAEQTAAAVARARQQITQVDERLKTLQAQMQDLSAQTSPRISLLRAQAKKLQAQAHTLWPPGQP